METHAGQAQPPALAVDDGLSPWPAWAVAAVWAVALGGAGLIVRRLLQARFLFIDEVSIGANVVSRTWSELAQPLDNSQMAPLGFLAAVKAAVVAMGPSEVSLRLTAAVAGVAALLALPLLVRWVLGPVAGLAAVAAVALNGVVIHYAT